mgnify:FL=1|tara:strand:- start:307 stop:507 length:201 start_codon:yes stop_codon:yes gene_type:complete
MATLREMAQAHLLNVQQQIADLENQKNQIDIDIKTLSDYLEQGVSELEEESTASEEAEQVEEEAQG